MFGLYRFGGAKCHLRSHLQERSPSVLRPTRAAGWAGCFCSCFQSNRMHFWAASLGPHWHLLPACTKVRIVLQSRLGSGSSRSASYCWTTSSEFWKTFQSTSGPSTYTCIGLPTKLHCSVSSSAIGTACGWRCLQMTMKLL